MARPVMTTKLFAPRSRRGTVARPRLLERLRRGAGPRLVLVSAPAGFGKTTLLAQWLGESAGQRRLVAWLSLDPADSDPVSFWTCVITALQTVVPGLGAGARELVASSSVPTQLMITTLVNELAEVPHDVWLVLDDYHAVDGVDVRDGMTLLLERLPAQVHVALATRADPDLPLARWRVRGELVEIRAGDLRFTADETAAYLGDVAGLDLAPGDVVALEERTEGWIAALQLAALSIQGRADVTGFIDRFTGDDRYVVDYLVDEVLSRQSEAVAEFLLTSSVVDRLTGSLCDAVTGGAHGRQMLVALERANLFLVPLDDRREWYRYHHLFADVLRARLRSERPDQVPRLHQRASTWFEAQEMTDDAVTHALAARDVDRAVRLMELAVPMMRRTRQDALFAQWLTALPQDAVRGNPVLSVFYGNMLMASGELDAVEARFLDAERALAAAPAGHPPWAQTEELHTLPATIAVHRAGLARARGDVDATAAHARAALDLARPQDHLARAGAAGLLASAAWARGDVRAALTRFEQVVASVRAAGSLPDELSATVILARMWLAAGRPSAARGLCTGALGVSQSRQEQLPGAIADLHVGLSEIDLDSGDLAGAERHLDVAAELSERAWLKTDHSRRFVAMGHLAEARGDPERALDLLGRAEREHRPGFLLDVRPIAAVRARLWIRQGELRQAGSWARQHRVSGTDETSYPREFEHLTFVRLVLARHRARQDPVALDEVLGLLERLLDAAGGGGRAGSVLEIRMLAALALDARGRRAQALVTLARAVAEAPEPEGCVRLFLEEGAPMVALLREVTSEGAAGDHARRVLGVAALRPSHEALSVREMQVLRLLEGELSGPQIARELFVSHNTLRSHTKHIFTKLDVTSRRAAVNRARERGLI